MPSDNTDPKLEGRKLFQSGESWTGNALGRPKGSRNKLGEAFVAALHDDFQVNGKEAIIKVRKDRPDVYLKVIAQVVPKELLVKDVSFEDMPDDELIYLLTTVRSLSAPGNGKTPIKRTGKTEGDGVPRGKPN
jgi:hypothetical protein